MHTEHIQTGPQNSKRQQQSRTSKTANITKDDITSQHQSRWKDPPSPRRGALRMLRGLMLRDLELLLCKQTKEKHISRECAFIMAPTRSIFQPEMH